MVAAICLAIVMATLAGAVYALTRAGVEAEVSASLSLPDALRTTDAGFKSVTAPRQFAFPEDHGPHPDYALEWWYFTGNLDTHDSRHFGYELTFFRVGITSGEFDRTSDWAARQMYTAHFALTDVQDEDFYAFERYSRDALGLAGAASSPTTPFRVWLEDWSVAATGDDTLPMRLYAASAGVGIDLTLRDGKGVVLNGEGGLSRKGFSHGEASYYYSLTRLPTDGTITLNGQTFAVSGLSWLDREWSSTQLSTEHEGWDWFSMQLSDGRDIMYGVLRPHDVNGRALHLGTVIETDGSYASIDGKHIRLDVLDWWESPNGGTYPSRWRFRMSDDGSASDPSGDSLDIVITPYISDQELDTIVRYWEGAVRIEGTSASEPISGSGYVELTGYAD
ncbi:MAG: carotenoid 1,2-hydratase [Chloroflexi bacterium]|nr:carotenoid 1,2-hydratase [Chloroflexota bacterium]